MATDNSQLDRTIEYALKEVCRTGDPEELPSTLRLVVLVHAAQGIIDNGGLQYFFESDFPNSPAYSVFSNAYREIGAVAEAELLDQAVALFPFSDPHKFAQSRNEHMDSFKDENGNPVDSPFETLTDKLCGNKEVWRLLEEFVKTNSDSFPR